MSGVLHVKDPKKTGQAFLKEPVIFSPRKYFDAIGHIAVHQ